MASLLERAAVVMPKVQGHYFNLEVERAQGCWLYDYAGRPYLDFAAGIAVASTGHCHPRVVQAICDQSQKLIHTCSAIAYSESHVALMEKLAQLCPGDLQHSFILQSGTEVIEAALKCATAVTQRTGLVCFEGAFHGRTLGATSVTFSKAKFRDPYQAWLIPQVMCLPFPQAGQAWDAAGFKKTFHQKVAHQPVAAIIAEPVLGESGYIFPPQGFLRCLRELATETGALLILDEIQSGCGRTGLWFACQAEGVVPDLLALAKGLGSGVTIGALVGRPAIMDLWPVSTHGGTYPGNPVNCAAALATLQVIEDEKLVDNARLRGEQLLVGLQKICQGLGGIKDIRGRGLMLAIECDGAERAKRVRMAAFERQLIMVGAGTHDQTLRIMPPLVVKAEEVTQALQILSEVLPSCCT